MKAEPLRVGVRCDAGPGTGVGHLVRCVALAEELLGRGIDVAFLGDTGGLDWARRQLTSRDLPLLPAPADPAALAEVASRKRLTAVVLDGYHLDPATGSRLRERGIVVLAVVDGAFGAEQAADLYLDQNLGAGRQPHWSPRADVLAGVRYALMRDLVRSRRPSAPPAPRTGGVPEVLAVFGGTDPFKAASTVAPLLLATGCPLRLSAIAAEPAVVRQLERLPRAASQQVAVRPPVDDLPALVAACDLVISAAGTSMWELCCLGAATAVVCVAANQEEGYATVVSAGLAAPAGRLVDLTTDAGARDAAVAELAGLLHDSATRARLAAQGWATVDGRGRERVVDALLARVPPLRSTPEPR